MAIPEGRLSTTPVTGNYYSPIAIRQHPTTYFERGPVAIEDTTQGLLFQNWMLVWNPQTTMFSVTPDNGSAIDLFTVADVTYASFTFDQAGRISLTYATLTSSYLYWYDTQLAQTVTSNLGAGVYTPVIYLDDKRETQSEVSDMLLWYTKTSLGDTYKLFMLRQRDRFLTEYEMADGLSGFYIKSVGLTDKFRIEIHLAGTGAVVTINPDNLDFESGDIHWTQLNGTEWSINQNNPETGQWNATLASTGAYSVLANDTMFPVTGSQNVTLKLSFIGTVGPGINYGFRAYDAGMGYLGDNQLGVNVTGTWQQSEWIISVPATAAYIQAVMSSNGQVGTYHVDNFIVIT